MAQTLVLIDYDLETHEIRRIIHPEDDTQIVQHPCESGNHERWGRVEADHKRFPIVIDEAGNARPLYGLQECIDEVERVTGRRPRMMPHNE
jgi:hypothetical protein